METCHIVESPLIKIGKAGDPFLNVLSQANAADMTPWITHEYISVNTPRLSADELKCHHMWCLDTHQACQGAGRYGTFTQPPRSHHLQPGRRYLYVAQKSGLSRDGQGHTHIYIYIHVYIYIYVYIYTCVYIYFFNLYICILKIYIYVFYIYVYIYIYISLLRYINIYIYSFLHTSKNIWIYIYIYNMYRGIVSYI